MIVNKMAAGGWEIIFQRHHALLAARLLSHLQSALIPDSVDHTAMLTAIAEHDDGQRDWQEGAFINDDGEPMDFTQYDYDLKHARKAVTEASYKSRYITLIISRHITELYSHAPNASDELKNYLSQQKIKQKSMLSMLKLSPAEFDRHYQLLRWCDELSLALCNNRSSYQLPALEVNGAKYQLSKKNVFHLQPWPFREDRLSLPIEMYRLSKEKFADNQDLFNELKQTTITVREVIMVNK
jgi:hypothetical protein